MTLIYHAMRSVPCMNRRVLTLSFRPLLMRRRLMVRCDMPCLLCAPRSPGQEMYWNWENAASLKTVLVGDLRSLIRHAHDATFSALTEPSLFIYFLILTTYTIAVPWALLKQDTANISRSLMETRWRLRISYSTEGWVWETESRREELGGTTAVDPEIQVSLNPRFLVSPINR